MTKKTGFEVFPDKAAVNGLIGRWLEGGIVGGSSFCIVISFCIDRRLCGYADRDNCGSIKFKDAFDGGRHHPPMLDFFLVAIFE